MIPSTNNLLLTDITIKQQPSRNYRMNFIENIIGKVDTLEAMKQVIFKILNTERYQHIIYSWNYGVELMDLIGEPVSYVLPEVERRITEALLQDDRIKSVSDFEFDTSKKKEVVCTFVVHTIFGDINTEKVVNY